MPKRKRKTDDALQPQRVTIYKKEEIMVETVAIVLKYNIYTNRPSNDMTLIEHAKTLNVDQLVALNQSLLSALKS